jgi:hypothetical protein
MDSARIWSQSAARRSIVGGERTHNPSPAASSLLGGRLAKFGRKRALVSKRRRAHKGNPLPGVVLSVLGGLGGKLGKRLKSKEAAHAERMARLAQLAERALLNDAEALAEIERLGREFATQKAKDAAKATLAAVRSELMTRVKAEREQTAAERRAAQREAGAAARAREQSFLTAGTSIASTAAQALLGGRSQRRAPTKRRRKGRTRSSF